MALLTVLNLTKKYGPILAVDNFSFEVAKGEIYALVGPDGAGKTTIIRTLCNLLEPDSGTVFIKGLDVFERFEAIKPLLGYMPQTFSLYPDLSVEENLIFYAGIYGVTGERYKVKRDYLYTFSNLQPFSDSRAGDLSGGMKQKLALSCALMHDPELLLLDEPTTGVDPLSRHQFWKILQDLKEQGVTIVVTTPYMDEVARADRACFVFRGKKLAEGSPTELTAKFVGKVFFLDVEPTTELLAEINQATKDQAMPVQVQRFGSGLHLYAPFDVHREDLTQLLQQIGIDSRFVTPISPSLEDTFIQLMGEIS
ncbi:MAG: ATP-binding cassette domain-containing protein [Candidatus Zixiibacteriota bacterium]